MKYLSPSETLQQFEASHNFVWQFPQSDHKSTLPRPLESANDM